MARANCFYRLSFSASCLFSTLLSPPLFVSSPTTSCSYSEPLLACPLPLSLCPHYPPVVVIDINNQSSIHFFLASILLCFHPFPCLSSVPYHTTTPTTTSKRIRSSSSSSSLLLSIYILTRNYDITFSPSHSHTHSHSLTRSNTSFIATTTHSLPPPPPPPPDKRHHTKAFFFFSFPLFTHSHSQPSNPRNKEVK
ncbi:MAG: hypothetical protein JOS17DRAFT_77768 [Linnemannia elongata]|nr:MAG: hypothetical protein JOS17DRAFT_77768 [Linnemannia elongata]